MSIQGVLQFVGPTTTQGTLFPRQPDSEQGTLRQEGGHFQILQPKPLPGGQILIPHDTHMLTSGAVSDILKVRIVNKTYYGVSARFSPDLSYTYAYWRLGPTLGVGNFYAGPSLRVNMPSAYKPALFDMAEFEFSVRTPAWSGGYRSRIRKDGLENYFRSRTGLTASRVFPDEVLFGESYRLRSFTTVDTAAALGLPGTSYEIRLVEPEYMRAKAIYNDARSAYLASKQGIRKVTARLTGEFRQLSQVALSQGVDHIWATHKGLWMPIMEPKREHVAAILSSRAPEMTAAIANRAAYNTGRGLYAWNWLLGGAATFNEQVFEAASVNVAPYVAGQMVSDQIAAFLTGYGTGLMGVGVVDIANHVDLPFSRAVGGILGGAAAVFGATVGYQELTRFFNEKLHLNTLIGDFLSDSPHPEYWLGGIHAFFDLSSALIIYSEIKFLAQFIKKIPGAIRRVKKWFDPPGPTSTPPRLPVEQNHLGRGAKTNISSHRSPFGGRGVMGYPTLEEALSADREHQSDRGAPWWVKAGLGVAAVATTTALAVTIVSPVPGDEVPANAAATASWGGFLAAAGL